ncbi:MAG: twin-arginine translocase subunit TatC [Gammaproteobacteria bacterium]
MPPTLISPQSLHYWLELRSRLLRCLGIIVLLAIIGCYFANPLYHTLAIPLLKQLPTSDGLIAIQLTSPLWVPFKLAFIVALLVSIPFILYQLWSFVSPALYRSERRRFWPLLGLSTLLFYAGVAFTYFVVFPLLFTFLIHTTPPGVEIRPDISQFLDLCLQLFLAFGLTFEVPVVTLLLASSGLVTIKQLAAARPYVIVGAFVIGMLFTPPDVLSQILLAVPICLLFELGLLLARVMSKEI